MENVLDILNERGYIEQITHPKELNELLVKTNFFLYWY